MKKRSGREMSSLMAAISICTLMLVLAVIAYFMIDIAVTTNANIKKDEEKMIEQSAWSLIELSNNIMSLVMNPSSWKLFNQETINNIITNRDWEAAYELIGDMALSIYPIEYVGTVRNGELVSYATRSGVEVDPDAMPLDAPQGGYCTLESLGNKKGLFVSTFFALDLSVVGMNDTIYINMIVDRTQEQKDIRDYFSSQRNSLLLRLSLVSAAAVVLTLLLTTLGLRYFTRKYVVKPIEELNRAAEEIAEGTYEGEVEVDPQSAYATLQGLLRSGQKVLSRMEKEME